MKNARRWVCGYSLFVFGSVGRYILKCSVRTSNRMVSRAINDKFDKW